MITTVDLAIIALYILGVLVAATVFARGQSVEGFLVNKRATKLFFLVHPAFPGEGPQVAKLTGAQLHHSQ